MRCRTAERQGRGHYSFVAGLRASDRRFVSRFDWACLAWEQIPRRMIGLSPAQISFRGIRPLSAARAMCIRSWWTHLRTAYWSRFV